MESWFDLKWINHFERHSLSINSFHRNDIWFTIMSNLENLANYILWPVSYKKYTLKGFQVDFEISKMSFIVWNYLQQNYWVPKWKIDKLFCGLFCQFLQNFFKKSQIRRMLLQEVAGKTIHIITRLFFTSALSSFGLFGMSLTVWDMYQNKKKVK